jgi:hypothetical protein
VALLNKDTKNRALTSQFPVGQRVCLRAGEAVLPSHRRPLGSLYGILTQTAAFT